VLALSDTGLVVGGRPVLRLALRVEVDGAEPYDTEASTVVPAAALALLRPGARVGVQIDATAPTTLAVDLARLSVTPAAFAA
jgi:hypothetical protein